MLRRIGRRDIFALAILGLAGIGIPMWLAASAGAIGIPNNDDWVYMRGAENLFRTGSLDVPGRTAASVGQLVIVQPLLWVSGGSPWAFTAFGLVMGFIGVAATYLLARRFVGTGSAAFVVLLVVAFPGFARETATFMTDVPAYAIAVLCLLFGAMWLQGEGGRLTLVASLGAGLLAVSIREFAIAAPAAVVVAAWARNRANERVRLACVSGMLAGGIACLLIVAALIPGRALPPTHVELGRLFLVGPAFVTVAAVLLPAVALGIGRRIATVSPTQLIVGAGLACLAFVIPWGSWPGGGGNLWTPIGLLGDGLLQGSRDPVICADVWALSASVAAFAAILVATLVVRWGQRNLAPVVSFSTATALVLRIARSRDGLLVLFFVAYAAELVVFTLIYGIWDRYLYPLIPAAAILLLRGPAQPRRLGRSLAFAHGAFAWLAASALVIAANSFAYDAARFREGDEAVAMGYDARTVDAGYEWVGYHSSGAGKLSVNGIARGQAWYEDLMWPYKVCAVVSNSPLDQSALRLIRVNRSAYRQFLFVGPLEPLYLYGAVRAGCPPPPVSSPPQF